MHRCRSPKQAWLRTSGHGGLRQLFCGIVLAVGLSLNVQAASAGTFNVRDYGATGNKTDNARPAIQKTLDACAAAGGGTILLPPGEYTSGTLHLRSNVRFQVEAGATLFASPDPKAYEFGQIPSKAALLFGEDLENVTITGQGTIDGQAEYEWRLEDFEKRSDHQILLEAAGRPPMRSFPKGFPARQIFPHLVWLGRSTNVHINTLKFLHSPSWTMALYACEQVAFENLYLYTSLKEAVWADGIDLDSCKNVTISSCNIETGDDCIIFISENSWGPPRVCENITVSHCRLSSASAGIKFSEGNRAGIRNISVHDTLLTNVNRGIVFSTIFQGDVTGVVFSNLVIYCNRFDWFWAGDGQPFHFRPRRPSESNQEPLKPGEPPPGVIRNVSFRNIVAKAKGSSPIYGHPESWLEGISFENVKLFLSTDSNAPYDKAQHALHFRCVKNLRLTDLEVFWEKPELKAWKSALYLEQIDGLELDHFAGRDAWPTDQWPAVALTNVANVTVRNSQAQEGTRLFLKVLGAGSHDIRLQGNDFRKAVVPYRLAPEVKPSIVTALENMEPK